MVDVMEPSEVARLVGAPFSYVEVGATDGALPSGYHHQRLEVDVGSGAAQFRRATEAVLGWRMHEAAGIGVRASAPRVQPGVVAALTVRVGPLAVAAPVRVLATVDEPSRQGFVYGTLPGHPERGEESFVVELLDDERVRFTLTAFSRPGRWFSRLARPVTKAVQLLVSERYASAVREAAGSSVPTG